jgi:hypothetical protein
MGHEEIPSTPNAKIYITWIISLEKKHKRKLSHNCHMTIPTMCPSTVWEVAKWEVF